MKTKNILMFIFAVAVFFLLANSFLASRKYGKLELDNSFLASKNQSLIGVIQQNDLLIESKADDIIALQSSYDLEQRRADSLQVEYNELKGHHDNLKDKAARVSAEKAYDFLQHKAYAFEGEPSYLFNEPQVKGIYLTFLEKQSLGKININLLRQADMCQSQLLLKSAEATLLKESSSLAMENSLSYKQISDNKSTIIVSQGNLLRKKNRNILIWKAAGIAVTAFAILN